jgi:Uma2 family endonuclease
MTPTTTEPIPIFPELTGTRRFTSDEYHRLIDAGILGPGDKVELLDGHIMFKADYPELTPADAAFPEWRWLRPFTSDEYHQMITLGVIGEDEKVELIEGYLVLKMPQSKAHRAAVLRLATRLPSRLPSGWVVMTQAEIAVGGMDPIPDGVVVRGADADYDERDVIEADFGIVIEVSNSSLEFDRRGKARLYARTGIPVYWVVNIPDRQVEVYTDPDPAANPPAYRTRTDYPTTAAVPVVLDGVAVATLPVADLIP